MYGFDFNSDKEPVHCSMQNNKTKNHVEEQLVISSIFVHCDYYLKPSYTILSNVRHVGIQAVTLPGALLS